MTEIAEGIRTGETPSPREALPKVERAALHTLGGRGKGIVLTDALLDLSPVAIELIGRYILRSLRSDNIRLADFQPESQSRSLSYEILEGRIDFLEGSRRMAELLGQAMGTSSSSAADLIVARAVDPETDQSLLALLKLDLQQAFRRDLVRQEGETRVRLTPVGDLLPDPDRRLQKAAFIPALPHDFPYDLAVLDQQAASPGRGAAGFFVDRFLSCRLTEGPRELTRRLPQETERWLQEEGATPTVAIQAREAVVQALHDPEIDLERLAGSAFEDRGQQERFLSHLDDAGFRERTFVPDPALADRYSSTLTYLLDGGVRISGDAEAVAALLQVDSDPTADGKVRICIESARFERKY